MADVNGGGYNWDRVQAILKEVPGLMQKLGKHRCQEVRPPYKWSEHFKALVEIFSQEKVYSTFTEDFLWSIFG